jgi:hypothetical protein
VTGHSAGRRGSDGACVPDSLPLREQALRAEKLRGEQREVGAGGTKGKSNESWRCRRVFRSNSPKVLKRAEEEMGHFFENP